VCCVVKINKLTEDVNLEFVQRIRLASRLLIGRFNHRKCPPPAKMNMEDVVIWDFWCIWFLGRFCCFSMTFRMKP